ncbi:hypothetical protein MLD38_018034 [Melastoma candidum]|uniref:Uncharacterized protein n=1 Tax=Melastoma candidum TaxID=119954 RepID=A0ACB9QUG9_9MYRT|nr:hypothetical protein MLD38_018034 [Melastoma candidum]
MKVVLSSACKQVQPLLGFQGGITDDQFYRPKDKVLFVMGATGTGKSRLAIDLATHFPAEIINSDKMQVYKGLDIVTNKVTPRECRGVPHHLLGVVDPEYDFAANDFRQHTWRAIESILGRDRLPIIAGGSNSFIDALVNDDPEFRSRHDCCFLWVDVSLPVLHSFVSERVDRMVEAGLVAEVRDFYVPGANNMRGLRRAIGVSELDEYLRAESTADEQTKARLLEEAIGNIKENTCTLACRQLQKIHRLHEKWNWNMHQIDASEVFLRRGKEEAEEIWERQVLGPSAMIVERFLFDEEEEGAEAATANIIVPAVPLAAAVAAVTH